MCHLISYQTNMINHIKPWFVLIWCIYRDSVWKKVNDHVVNWDFRTSTIVKSLGKRLKTWDFTNWPRRWREKHLRRLPFDRKIMVCAKGNRAFSVVFHMSYNGIRWEQRTAIFSFWYDSRIYPETMFHGKHTFFSAKPWVSNVHQVRFSGRFR